MQEIFKRHPWHEGYHVGTRGTIISYKSGKPHILCNYSDGRKSAYHVVTVRVNNKAKSIRVHRLVLETYVGKRPHGYDGRHLNGNQLDNRLENLAWGTKKENGEDRVRHGTSLRCGKRKVSNKQLAEINLRLAKGDTQKSIAEDYNIHQSTVSYIKYKKRLYMRVKEAK